MRAADADESVKEAEADAVVVGEEESVVVEGVCDGDDTSSGACFAFRRITGCACGRFLIRRNRLRSFSLCCSSLR